ncbi:MAG: hypothetical protein OEU36_20100 [Gammaproteobacteria bacterium]|nr:hypothetical protein [Gammaproteobacteria bacterium]
MTSWIGNGLFALLWAVGVIGIFLDMGWWWALAAGIFLPLSALAGFGYSIEYLEMAWGIWAAVALWITIIIAVSIAFKLSR